MNNDDMLNHKHRNKEAKIIHKDEETPSILLFKNKLIIFERKSHLIIY